MSQPRVALPLVFVHAFPMGPRMWARQMSVISGRQALAPPLPGFDGHPRVAEPTMDAYARDVLASLDRAGIDRAIFCGLSLGGYVVFGILRQALDRVGGLILADTRTTIDTPERRAARVRSIQTARTAGPPAIADEMGPGLVSADTHAKRPAVDAEIRALIEAQTADAIADGLQAMMTRPDSAPDLAKARVPTLIIVGADDGITPVSDARSMQEAIPGSRLVIIPGAGHMSNLEAPEAFNTALVTFLGEAGI